MNCFQKPYTHSKNKIAVDLKATAGIDTLEFPNKNDLANLKSNVEDLGIEKVKTVLVYLSELSNIVKMMLLK